MPVNIEIKARLRNRGAVEKKARSLSDGPAVILEQEDIFFPCLRGRLKLRIEDGKTGQLIYYVRPDKEGPKASHYHVTHVSDPEGLRASLSLALGIKSRVRKERTLYLKGRTRIHLDRVEGLGDFMELEVVLKEGEYPESGKTEAEYLMKELDILKEDLVEGAYADLLTDKGQ